MLRQLYCLLFWCAVLVMSVGGTAAPGAAQSYPSNLIRIVVGATAGSPPDVVTRIIANELGESEGWRIVVENKPGASGTIGGAEVLKQPADGYTIFTTALFHSAAPAFQPNISFRLDTDFAPVINLMTAYHVVVVNPSVPAKSLSELVALLKDQPDKLTFSSGGFGTPAHLAGELFKLQTGVRVAHVPYRGVTQAIGDLLNGTNHYQFITPLPVLNLVEAGKLRALAVTAPTRMPALKDVPTVVEEGFPELIIQDWIGFVVKSGTPNDVVVRLNKAVNKALAKESVREALTKIAGEPAGGSSEEFGAHIKSQVAYWGKVVKDSGIKMRE